MPKGKGANNKNEENDIYDIYNNDAIIFDDDFWKVSGGKEELVEFDRNLFQDLEAHAEKYIDNEHARIEYLADLAYIHDTQDLPENQKAALERYIVKNMIPIKDGELDQNIFNLRIGIFREKLKSSYQAVSRAAASKDGSPDLSSFQKTKDYINNVHNDEEAQKIYKWYKLINVLSSKASAARRNALIPMCKGYKVIDCSEFQEAEALAEYLKPEVEVYEQMMDRAGTNASIGTYITGAIHIPLNSELSNAPEKEKEKIRFAQKYNPENRKTDILKQCGPSKEEERELTEYYGKEQKKLEDRTISRFVSEGLNSGKEQKNLKNLCLSLRDKDFINTLRGSFFNKPNEISAARARTRLSFGRKGSTEFQNMEKSVDEVTRLLSKAINGRSVNAYEKNSIVLALRDTLRKVQIYTKNKMGDRTIDQIRNENSKKRILYAQNIEKQAMTLLRSLEGLKKSATAADGVEGIEGSSIKNKAGTFIKLAVPEDFKQAAERSELKDRVCFEKWQDDKWIMIPKYPERGHGRNSKREFSIRKNMNYLMKGMAGSYFKNPERPESKEFNAKTGNDKVKMIESNYKRCLNSGPDLNRAPYIRNIAELLHVPEKDRGDFSYFLNACIDSKVRIDLMGEQMCKDAEIAQKMRTVYASKTSSKKEKSFVKNRIIQYNNALSYLAGAAMLDPEKQMRIILPNDSLNSAHMMKTFYNMALKRNENHVLDRKFDYLKQRDDMLNAKENLETVIEKFGVKANELIPSEMKPMSAEETAKAIRLLAEADMSCTDIKKIKEYFCESPLIPAIDRKDSRYAYHIEAENLDKIDEEDLMDMYRKLIPMHVQCLADNQAKILDDISKRVEEKKIDQEVPNFEKHAILEAGSVNYKGKEYQVIFEGVSQNSKQLIHGIGMRGARIGIFRKQKDIDRLYLSEAHYNDVESVKEKCNFTGQEFKYNDIYSPMKDNDDIERQHKNNAYDLLYEKDASEKDILIESGGRKNIGRENIGRENIERENIGRERTSFSELLDQSWNSDGNNSRRNEENRNDYVRISPNSSFSNSEEEIDIHSGRQRRNGH